MREINKILGNIFLIAYLTILLFLLGIKNANRIVIFTVISLLGILLVYLFLKIRKKEFFVVFEENQIDKRKKLKSRVLRVKRIIQILVYFVFFTIIALFWFGQAGNVWLRKSVDFFRTRFSNKYLFNIAIFVFPLLYWISFESLYRNVISYFYKKYKLEEIDLQ
ncbi:MAG: hypothetical protein J6X84_01540 [Treponema sp.]|nr:hypothetical protein [Treponema sp.]